MDCLAKLKTYIKCLKKSQNEAGFTGSERKAFMGYFYKLNNGDNSRAKRKLDNMKNNSLRELCEKLTEIFKFSLICKRLK